MCSRRCVRGAGRVRELAGLLKRWEVAVRRHRPGTSTGSLVEAEERQKRRLHRAAHKRSSEWLGCGGLRAIFVLHNNPARWRVFSSESVKPIQRILHGLCDIHLHSSDDKVASLAG